MQAPFLEESFQNKDEVSKTQRGSKAKRNAVHWKGNCASTISILRTLFKRGFKRKRRPGLRTGKWRAREYDERIGFFIELLVFIELLSRSFDLFQWTLTHGPYAQ